MILYLLLVGFSATAESGKIAEIPLVPPYAQSLEVLNLVALTLREQVLSLSPNIPTLNDHRRHYAEIVYVIANLGETQSGCVFLPYRDYYQKFINESAPEGFSNPQKIIDKVQNTITDFNRKTKGIQLVINRECENDRALCDLKVQEIIDASMIGSTLSVEAELLLSAAKAARKFLKRDLQITQVSHEYRSLQFVIDGVDHLEDVVMAYADYLRTLNSYPDHPC